MAIQPLFDEPFLRAHWGSEFEHFQAGPDAAALLARLQAWANREQLTERSSEAAFIQRFFVETWGYRLQGHALRDANVTEAFDAKRLIRILLDLRTTEDAPLRTRILTLDQEITALDTTIAAQETTLNTQIYRLYRLSPEEIQTVEAG